MEYHMIPPADDYYKNQSKNKNSLKALESIQKQKPEKSLINTHTHTHTHNSKEKNWEFVASWPKTAPQPPGLQLWKPKSSVTQGARSQNIGLGKQVKI